MLYIPVSCGELHVWRDSAENLRDPLANNRPHSHIKHSPSPSVRLVEQRPHPIHVGDAMLPAERMAQKPAQQHNAHPVDVHVVHNPLMKKPHIRTMMKQIKAMEVV